MNDWACPGCGRSEFHTLFRATDRLYRLTENSFYLVECRACRLISLYPRPAPEELRTYYPDSYWFITGESAGGRIQEAYRRFVLAKDHVRFVRRAIESARERGPVLDVGCGGGLFLGMLKQGGSRVLGLDSDARAAALAWRRYGVPAFAADLAAAPLPPESCAAVTMFHVLEHVYDPEKYLLAARALLRPRGRLIVQVPNAACWQFLLLGENWRGIDVPRHLVDFRARDLERLLAYCGLEVVRRKDFSLRDNPAAFATSVAPWLDPGVRRVRGAQEGTVLSMAKDLLYFALVLAAIPFSVLEAACRSGSTVMFEARKKA